MSDDRHTGTPEEDKETNDLLALLYPDDDASVSSAQAADHVSSDELLGMQGLRSLFRDLPEEEPSDAVTNKLLAMAAQHAPTPKTESRGFFAWLSDTLMPVVSHPGLAAAATLVLVVGVAGTLYVKGGAEMAEPQVSSRSEAPSLAPAMESVPEGSAVADTIAAEPPAEPAALNNEDPAAPEPVTASGEVVADGRRDERKPDVGKPNVRKSDIRQADKDYGYSASPRNRAGSSAPKKKRIVKGASILDDLSRDSASAAQGFGGGGLGKSGAAQGPGSSGNAANQPERRAPQSRNKQPVKPKPAPKTQLQSPSDSSPQPAPPPSTDESLADAEDDGLEEREEKAKEDAKGSSTAASLHKKAIAAAKRGDCGRVLDLGSQIRKLDSSYYDRTFLSDTRLKACRAAKK